MELTREGREARIYAYSGWNDPYFQAEWNRLREEGLLPEEIMGIHAALPETAEMLADRPHLVKKEKMVKPALKRTEQFGYFWFADEISETGAFGDPSAYLGHHRRKRRPLPDQHRRRNQLRQTPLIPLQGGASCRAGCLPYVALAKYGAHARLSRRATRPFCRAGIPMPASSAGSPTCARPGGPARLPSTSPLCRPGRDLGRAVGGGIPWAP